MFRPFGYILAYTNKLYNMANTTYLNNLNNPNKPNKLCNTNNLN